MDAVTLLLFAIGLIILVVGANLLVGGASALAISMGISSLVIGLTVVSLGTSAPELAVVLQSSITGEAGIGVGNVVGSSVFNVLFILGLSALIAPLVVSSDLLKQDGPVMGHRQPTGAARWVAAGPYPRWLYRLSHSPRSQQARGG